MVACGDKREARGRVAGFGRPSLLPRRGFRCIFKDILQECGYDRDKWIPPALVEIATVESS